VARSELRELLGSRPPAREDGERPRSRAQLTALLPWRHAPDGETCRSRAAPTPAPNARPDAALANWKEPDGVNGLGPFRTFVNSKCNTITAANGAKHVNNRPANAPPATPTLMTTALMRATNETTTWAAEAKTTKPNACLASLTPRLVVSDPGIMPIRTTTTASMARTSKASFAMMTARDRAAKTRNTTKDAIT